MCDAQCQNPLGPGRSLFTLQSSEDDDRRGSDAPLRIITPPPDTQRHFKSTQPPPPPLLLSSHWSKEEITVSLSLSLLTSSLFHTHRKEKHSHTVRWPGRGSTSLNKTGLIIPSSLFLLLLLLFLPPTAIIYRSGSHCITDKHLHHFSSFSFGSAAQQECRTDRVVSTLCGGGEGVSDVKSKCQHPSGS